jgi:hypothetical protein
VLNRRREGRKDGKYKNDIFFNISTLGSYVKRHGF